MNIPKSSTHVISKFTSQALASLTFHFPSLHINTTTSFCPSTSKMASHTFDDVLGLEEQFYHEGYQQGLSDGITAGSIEGRTFGLEKGFEKYVESGRLYGKAIIWANRVPQFQKVSNSANETSNKQVLSRKIPQLSYNARLAKHVKTLHALAESESLSTENTEEAVSDFDDRWKRAQAKAKIIERMVGEVKEDSGGQGKSSGDGSIEDVSVLNSRH